MWKRIVRMSDDDAVAAFQAIRFHATEGQPVCVWCECAAAYPITTRPGVFKCKACLRFFSLTSRTIFTDHKLSYRDILKINAIRQANEARAKAHASGA